MGVAEILHEIDTLPADERWKALEHTRHLAEIERGEVIELDEALKELDQAE